MKTGLYQPHQFKDNCGFGLIAQMEGKQSYDLLKTAIESLTSMTHRGGIAADGKTGDGCGLLFQSELTRSLCNPFNLTSNKKNLSM